VFFNSLRIAAYLRSYIAPIVTGKGLPLRDNAFSRKEILFIFLITIVCLVLFFYKLGQRPLWEYDEAMHAQVAKEMLQRGDWCTPVFNGENFYDKPVLHFWLVIGSYLVLGVNELAARLPSAMLGMLGALLVYVWARTLYGSFAALLSALVLATSVEYVVLSQNIIHDLALSLFISIALFLFHRASRENGFTRITFVCFYAALGGAVLTKGPIGLLLPGLIIFLYLLKTKQWHLILNRNIFAGAAIFLIIALPWYIIMALRHDDYLQAFLIKGNIARFFSRKSGHREPFYFYIQMLAAGFFPWSVFIPSALYLHFQSFRRKKDNDSFFLLLAAVAPIIFFSLSRSKLPTYILPVFPALAILIGSFWEAGLRPEAGASWARHLKNCSLIFFFFILAVSGFGIVYIYSRYPLYTVQTALGCAALLFFALLFLILGRKEKVLYSFFSLVAMMVIIFTAAKIFVLPEVSHFKSARELAGRMKLLLPPGEPAVFYRDIRESVIFYSGRRAVVIETKEELAAFLSSPQPVFCLISIKTLDKIKHMLHSPYYLVDQEGYFALVSNRKNPNPDKPESNLKP
jgi:4-amino-4-deoxy-L-arabinose transferase-like glycosyltransferase